MNARSLLPVLLLSLAACAPEASEEEGQDVDQANDAINAASELDAQSIADLRAAGFSEKEINAVGESVVVSKRLGIQSFVSENNDGSAKSGIVRRESHGKGQGCLRAKVDVTADAGLSTFSKGKSYPAWLRISNGGAFQKDDKSTHISRGFGLKLMNVAGTPTGTHDFLFITSPRFFIHDVTHYPGFLRSSGNGRVGFLANVLFGMSWEEKKVIFHRLSLKVSNLLESPEYSAVPYSFGGYDKPVKYALARCDAGAPPVSPESHDPPDGAGPNYLEDSMNATLQSSDADAGICYAFFVQKPRSEREDPVDNPTQAWEGAFERVATVTIPHGQHKGGEADYTKNDAECERMAFDPWNAPSDSAPLGKTNWTRKLVYKKLAEFRRVELPKVYAKWMQNHDDASIPADWRNELAKLRDPDAAMLKVAKTDQPDVDEGFRTLGIVR
jgi:hypothetical protein